MPWLDPLNSDFFFVFYIFLSAFTVLPRNTQFEQCYGIYEALFWLYVDIKALADVVAWALNPSLPNHFFFSAVSDELNLVSLEFCVYGCWFLWNFIYLCTVIMIGVHASLCYKMRYDMVLSNYEMQCLWDLAPMELKDYVELFCKLVSSYIMFFWLWRRQLQFLGVARKDLISVHLKNTWQQGNWMKMIHIDNSSWSWVVRARWKFWSEDGLVLCRFFDYLLCSRL